MSIVGIMFLWTCGLTPLWVNVVGTCVLGIRFGLSVVGAIFQGAK